LYSSIKSLASLGKVEKSIVEISSTPSPGNKGGMTYSFLARSLNLLFSLSSMSSLFSIALFNSLISSSPSPNYLLA